MEKFIITRKIMKDMWFPRGLDLPPDKSFMNAQGWRLAFPLCTYSVVGFFFTVRHLPARWFNVGSPKFRDQQFLALTVMMFFLPFIIRCEFCHKVYLFIFNHNSLGTWCSDSLISHLFSQATFFDFSFWLFSDGFISRWSEMTIFYYKRSWPFFFFISSPQTLNCFLSLSCHEGVHLVLQLLLWKSIILLLLIYFFVCFSALLIGNLIKASAGIAIAVILSGHGCDSACQTWG